MEEDEKALGPGMTYFELTKELDEARQELEETQEDLDALLAENAKLSEALDAVKPVNDEATQQHLQHLMSRLQQAESILMSLTLSVGGYHGSGKR